MKPHKSSPSSPKRSAAIVTPIILLLVLALVCLYDMTFSNPYPRIHRVASSSSSSSLPSPTNTSSSASPSTTVEACDLTRGQWVPDDEAPYYTNLTCPFIDDHQNCMKFGKPSLEFMRWRWQPDGCDLPRFDAARFLEAMRGKSMAFVGDSLARNHLKSLLCLLSKEAQPVEVGTSSEIDVTGRAVRRDYHYRNHSFSISLFWSPFLVKANQSNATLGQWDLHLDTPDTRWAAHIADFDYIVLSGTNWFLRPSFYREAGRVVARNGAAAAAAGNVTEMPVPRAVRAAFRTALGAIAAREGFRGKVVLRSVTPAHFEDGEWNTGGDCVRTRPFRRDERALGAVEAEYRAAQVDALRETEAAARRNGAEMLLLDITEAMDLRPDGHPSRYGHPPGGSVEGSFVVDCLHWCLPGPIDMWSELLLQLLIAHPS
ncbi:unnamed protein product [Urochloa decumbens]|uniref:Trichome birefringence-like N-terminal domain-containing protein n=1 Tax=Urochloa decumbens TaxID=240449 RepID=A0ABC9CDK9_9POAL